MRLCFINPPNSFGRAPLPHMGIAYIGGMIIENFKEVETDIIDCPFEQIGSDKLRMRVLEQRYDLIGITTYYYNFSEVFKLVRFLNKLDKPPFIILGGYYPTLHPKKAFNIPGIDCICVGEGEFVFKELVHALETNSDWRHIGGLAYLNEKGEMIQNPPNPLIEDLDQLPRPYLKKAPLYWYPLVSGRGCHGRCTFCSIVDYYKKVPGKKNRKRCPLNVVMELKDITSLYKNKIVWMMDDNFFAVLQFDKGWIDDFVYYMKQEKVISKFKIFARADEIDKEILIKLQSVGLCGVVVGMESMIPRQLKLYGKNIKPEMNKKAMEILHELGLWLDMGFILLDPYTTLEELKINLDFLKYSLFTEIAEPGHELISSLGPLIALEDTPIHRHLSKKNILSGSDVGYNFQIKEIDLFYKGMRLWNQKIFNEYFDFNQKKMFQYYETYGRLEEKYILIYKECLVVDIEFMSDLAKQIIEDTYREDTLEALLKKHSEVFFNILKKADNKEINTMGIKKGETE